MTERVSQVTGLSAIAGGLLRVVDAFADQLMPHGVVDGLYLATDVLLLGGATGLWLKQRATLGLAGHAGLAIFVLGILLVRLSALHVAGVPYQLGAGVALIGLALYSIEALLRGTPPQWAAVLWLLALVPGFGTLLGAAPLLIMLSGAAFGLGFVVIGVRLLRN